MKCFIIKITNQRSFTLFGSSQKRFIKKIPMVGVCVWNSRLWCTRAVLFLPGSQNVWTLPYKYCLIWLKTHIQLYTFHSWHLKILRYHDGAFETSLCPASFDAFVNIAQLNTLVSNCITVNKTAAWNYFKRSLKTVKFFVVD